MEIPQPLWQPLLVLGHPTVKKGLIFSWTLLCFSLCLLPLFLSPDATENSLPLSYFHPSFGYFQN